jgi:hypothetical protein
VDESLEQASAMCKGMIKSKGIARKGTWARGWGARSDWPDTRRLI